MYNELIKSMTFNQPLDMIYITKNGVISKRRIKVLQVKGDYFQASCYLRKSKRTFKIESVLALVPVIVRERMVI